MHLKDASHAQAGVDFEAASREQLALEYEATACAISSGSPRRPSGMGEVIFASASGFMLSTMGVRMNPGATAPTRMP